MKRAGTRERAGQLVLPALALTIGVATVAACGTTKETAGKPTGFAPEQFRCHAKIPAGDIGKVMVSATRGTSPNVEHGVIRNIRIHLLDVEPVKTDTESAQVDPFSPDQYQARFPIIPHKDYTRVEVEAQIKGEGKAFQYCGTPDTAPDAPLNY